VWEGMVWCGMVFHWMEYLGNVDDGRRTTDTETWVNILKESEEIISIWQWDQDIQSPQ